MARLTNIFRSDEINVKVGRRQLPLIAGENLIMLMDLSSRGLVIDGPLVRGRELEEFTRKYNILSHDELKSSLEVSTQEFTSVLSQSVQCVGCRRSVERLFYQLMLSGHPTLDPLVITSNGILTLSEEKVKIPQSICTLLHKHNIILSKLLDNQSKNKKSLRCALHSLDSFRSRPFSEIWREIWGSMKHRCREELTVIEAKELHDILDNYLKKHKFCQECRTKVEKAYNLLINDTNLCKEKGYVAALYSNIRKCLTEKHIHIQVKVDFIDSLIRRAEPEVKGSYARQRERHAKTLEIAQEEVLICVGICIYERLRKIYVSLREEEHACQVLAAVGAHALCRRFDISVEKKQGISNLELLYKEISRAEKAKEQKRVQKKLKKMRKKNNMQVVCNVSELRNELPKCLEKMDKNDLTLLVCHCEKPDDICTKSIDGGYSSELSSHVNSRTPSIACSIEEVEVSYPESLCTFEHSLRLTNFPNENNNLNTCKNQTFAYKTIRNNRKSLSLEEMLNDFEDDASKSEDCYIPEEVVLEFKCRESKIKKLREELRENLRQNFAQMCVKTKMAQENCRKYKEVC